MSAETGVAVLAIVMGILIVVAALLAWYVVRAAAKLRNSAPKRKPATPLTRLTAEQIQTYRAWYDKQGLDAAMLTIGDEAQPRATGSHIGGGVVLPESEPWPKGRSGNPLSFLAQLDFSELPMIPGFPEQGVLQFFIGQDDLYGADFEDPFSGDFKVLWRPQPIQNGELRETPPPDEDCSPLRKELRKTARRLKAEPFTSWPSAFNIIVEEHDPEMLNTANAEELTSYFDAKSAQHSDRHHVGGHVEFTQSDFRLKSAHVKALDTVLLQLWSERNGSLMWGDMGQANFMITKADLQRRDFTRVSFQWDCT